MLTGGNVLVFAAVADRERIAALDDRGAEVVVLPNAAGKVDLAGDDARSSGGAS